jgi:hydroxysqualene dehydroxylase
MSGRTVVVGGGLAGVAAALARADRGDAVTLLEARPRLGGLAGSANRGTLPVDTGQHVFLRCCTAYRALLDRLGAGDRVVLQDRLTIPVARPGPGGQPLRGSLRRGSLPPPAHLAPALAGYRLLGPADRLRAARGALALRRVDPADPAADRTSFAKWLAGHGQNDATVTALWDLIGVAALNAPAARASLALAAMVFRTALLTDAAAGDIGWARVPLGDLHDTAARAALDRAGVVVRTGARVRRLDRHGRRWLLTDRQGEPESADRVVLAVPPETTEELLPPGAVDRPAGWGRRLGSAPIVNVHVRYDRPVLDVPFLAAVDSPVQWIFDRTAQAGLGSGQYLAVSLSAAHGEVRMPTAQLRARFLPALADLLPAARAAQVLDCFVTRVPAATIDPGPGQAARRPPAATALPGLVLAGAWTATGWPATMEGAVRSGQTAAAELDHAGSADANGNRPARTAEAAA